MSPDRRRFEGDAYSSSRLPMARRYPDRPVRGRLFAIGGAAALLLCIVFLGDTFMGGATTVAGGPLSQKHALFGKDCASCHTPGEGTPDAKCNSCHETAADPMGSHGFARHYLYRSGDVDRSAPSTLEMQCSACHTEHEGRGAPLTKVADVMCTGCHENHRFRDQHPDFAFATERTPDPAGLRFGHVQHVREVMDRRELEDIEATCPACHEPEPEGRFFQPISFARHCDECHFERRTDTPPIPLASADGRTPGVLTVQAIRRDPAGIAAGADYWDPSEVTVEDGAAVKQPVYHEDPWVLYNLERLRERLYPGAALASLLRASADVPARDAGILVEEAASTLRARIAALHGLSASDVQDELRELQELLDIVTRRLEDPFAPIDATRFDVRVTDRSDAVPAGSPAEHQILDVVDSLTAPCQSCHIVRQATIERVQKDQRTLNRADFDHGAHIIHARCLDCHTEIPIRDFAGGPDDPPPDRDVATIENLPRIASCRSCHEPGGSPDACTTCHRFHPNAAHWSNLSRAVRSAR